ncbi:centromere protein U isoform X1 [Silurus meridionalis]|nr:centromere protein U isoform X1 [Silurus meridionalis]
MSSIEKASFFQGEEYSSHGNPLHSTALEDESRPDSDHQHKATAKKQTSKGRENERKSESAASDTSPDIVHEESQTRPSLSSEDITDEDESFINRSLNQKKTRLLEAKNELIKSKAEVRKLEKEHSDLEQRLTALKQGTAFLNNLKVLNRRYLQHRSTHTDEPETYGPSCMPAMLLEARSITGTENLLKNINDKLQQVLEETAHKKHCMQ